MSHCCSSHWQTEGTGYGSQAFLRRVFFWYIRKPAAHVQAASRRAHSQYLQRHHRVHSASVRVWMCGRLPICTHSHFPPFSVSWCAQWSDSCVCVTQIFIPGGTCVSASHLRPNIPPSDRRGSRPPSGQPHSASGRRRAWRRSGLFSSPGRRGVWRAELRMRP